MEQYTTTYRTVLLPAVQKELQIKNVHAVPKLTRVHINVGIGTFLKNSKDYSPLVDAITRIAGQKPMVTMSRKAISNFKLRENQPNGITVTLRGQRMLDFVNKLTNVVLPRVRDFRGIPFNSFDGRGNYTLGMTEHTVFPEIRSDEDIKPFGLQITIVTSAQSDDEGKALLRALGFPFRIPQNKAK